jgi:hypothetical protein
MLFRVRRHRSILLTFKKLMIGKLGRPGLFRVKRVILTVRRSLLVFIDKRTFSEPVNTSVSCRQERSSATFHSIISLGELDFGCRLIALYLGLFMQNGVQERIVNLYLSIVADEPKFAELVHEVAHAGSGRSNHLCQCFLADIQ